MRSKLPRDPSIDPIADALLRSWLVGEAMAWPTNWGDKEASQFVARTIYHGVAGILLSEHRLPDNCPATVVSELKASAQSFAMWELRHRDLIRNIGAALADSGSDAILLKGSALAYTLYSNPALRERGDSDVLVRPYDREAVRMCFSRLGLRQGMGNGLADLFVNQESWSIEFGDGTVHEIDLHFRPMNFAVFGQRIAFEHAARGRVALASVGRGLFAPSRSFLLFHACLHRRAHECSPYFSGGKAHFGGNRLIWLKDVDLLARAMTEEEWDDLVARADAAGEVASCLAGLKAAAGTLKTPLPTEVMVRLEELRGRSSPYFESGKLGRAWMDLSAIPGAADKLRYMRSRLFPTRRFMRSKYPSARRHPLLFLYARRMLELAARRPGRST